MHWALQRSYNPWAVQGETMSLKKACEKYNVTVEECQVANIELKWRTRLGKSYAFVLSSDVEALSHKLAEEKAQAKEKALLEKYGEEGLKKMRQEQAEKKKAEAEAKQTYKEWQDKTDKLAKKTIDVLQIVGSYGRCPGISNEQLTKTAAKKNWFLKDEDLEKIHSKPKSPSKVHTKSKATVKPLSKAKGRCSVKYPLIDLIVLSESKHPNLLKKLKALKSPDTERLKQYASYLELKLQKETRTQEPLLVTDAMKQVKTRLESQVNQSQVTLQKATADLEEKQSQMRSFDTFMNYVSPAGKENGVGEHETTVQCSPAKNSTMST